MRGQGGFKTNDLVVLDGDDEVYVVVEVCSYPYDPILHLSNRKGTYTFGIAMETASRYRKTHCWNCKYKPLTNAKHPICENCDWIICPQCHSCSANCVSG